jgi:hypothetical protein
MTFTEYEHADRTIDVAPESYLNIGAVQLMRNVRADDLVMRRAVGATPPEEIRLWPIYD